MVIKLCKRCGETYIFFITQLAGQLSYVINQEMYGRCRRRRRRRRRHRRRRRRLRRRPHLGGTNL